MCRSNFIRQWSHGLNFFPDSILPKRGGPQDGRIKTTHKGKEIELRVSTLPVAFGEKVVIRIFDPEILMQDLDSIGFYPREFQLYNAFINKPNGIILVTGPTGSGKTTTLYSSLRALVFTGGKYCYG